MELKKLKREQLLEILLKQQQTIEEQEKIIKDLEKKLEDKAIIIENAGSIAEASLSLNKVFESAQAACEQYILNIKKMGSNREEENE